MAAGVTTAGIAPKAANVVFQRKKRVFHPGVADLLKALVVIGPQRSSDKGFAEQPGDQYSATETNPLAGRHCYKSLSPLPDPLVFRRFQIVPRSRSLQR